MDASENAVAVLQIVRAVAQAIKEIGEVSSGNLYAHLMDRMTLNQYQEIIGVLKDAGVVTETNNILK